MMKVPILNTKKVIFMLENKFINENFDISTKEGIISTNF